MSLAKRHALVTGSTSGIGLAIARALAKEGADIVINGFGDKAAIEAERAGIEKEFGVKAFYNGADMSKGPEIAAMIADAKAKMGSLDILVNNAGIQHVAPVRTFRRKCGTQSSPSILPRRSMQSAPRFRG